LLFFLFFKTLKSSRSGTKIGTFLVENVGRQHLEFNVVASFLNMVVSDGYYVNFFNQIKENEYGKGAASSNAGKTVLVEYSSPTLTNRCI
jgi:arginyl-tRNA synthetase